MRSPRSRRFITATSLDQIPTGIAPFKYLASNGYVMLAWTVSTEVQLRCYEHRYVMGFPLKGKHVHHKNGIKTDNRPENLEVVSTKEHGERHSNYSIDHAAQLYASGLSLADVAANLGTDKVALLRRLRLHGYKRRSRSDSGRLRQEKFRRTGFVARNAKKLTPSLVVAIRSEYESGTSQSAIARRYGLTSGTVWCVVSRRSWRHVA